MSLKQIFLTGRTWSALAALILSVLACNFPLVKAQPTSPGLQPTAPIPAATTALPSQTPSETSIPSATPPPLTPTPNYQPRFEPAECAFPVPPGYTPECGYLVVPENRARPEGAQVRLHVAIFPSSSANPLESPVVHLAGGPGSSSLGVAGYLFQQGMDAVLDQQDLILYDQRGTGYSTPRLDCPEREALTPALLDGSLSREEANQAIVDAFRRCHDRLASEGIDLEAYTSAASAADLDDLRRSLGYPQLDLYAVSYGTRLALTMMRDHPEAVRSAVLDSTYPLEVNLYTALAPNAERAFNALFEACSNDASCSQNYPNLEDDFYALADQLNARPVTVLFTAGGAEQEARLDGGLLVDVLFVGLDNPAVAATMPQMIESIRQGDYAILRERLGLYFDNSTALGMQTSVQCAEEIPFSPPAEAFTAAQGAHPQIADFFPESVQPLFTACQSWHPAPPDPVENMPVTSEIPTLVLAGELDPITPPAWGQEVAGELSHAFFYRFPGNGHWVTRSSACARAMALAFWADPTSAPPDDCLSSETGLKFTP